VSGIRESRMIGQMQEGKLMWTAVVIAEEAGGVMETITRQLYAGTQQRVVGSREAEDKFAGAYAACKAEEGC
jgi:hypothetical protein